MRAVLLLLLVSGCATAADRDQVAVTHRRLDADFERREAERQRQEAEDRRVAMACISPPDETWVRFCAQRERDRDRAAQQAQWDRENAQMQAALELQRQQLELQRKENTRRAIIDVQRAAMAPWQL